MYVKISTIQNYFTMCVTIFHAYPRFDAKWVLTDLNDSCSPCPIPIATIASVPCVAEPQLLVWATPVQSMVVSREYCLTFPNNWSVPR